MNPLNTPRALLVFACALASLSPRPAHAFGFDHGNPGDMYIREFSTTAQDLYGRMKLLPASELNSIDMNMLALKINTVTLESRDTVTDPDDNSEVPAWNIPSQNRIIVNKHMWNDLKPADKTEERLQLVLHEYLEIMLVDDTKWAVSGKIIPQLVKDDFNSGKIWNPMNPINHIATNLVYNPSPDQCKLNAMEFDTSRAEEDVTVETDGTCGDSYRKVITHKSSLQAPPSSGWRGTFQRFEIHVQDSKGNEVGQTTVEPEWGQCLLPTDGACQVGGKIFTGGVEFVFWFQRQLPAARNQ